MSSNRRIRDYDATAVGELVPTLRDARQIAAVSSVTAFMGNTPNTSPNVKIALQKVATAIQKAVMSGWLTLQIGLY